MKIAVVLLFLGVAISNVLMVWSILDENLHRPEIQQIIFDTKYSDCLQKYLNHTVLAEEITEAMAEDDLPRFMKNNCPKWHHAVECYDIFSNDIRPHLNFLQRLALQSIKGVIKSTIGFICENDGKRLLEFIKRDGLECLEVNKDKLQGCVAPNVSRDIMNSINFDDGSISQSIAQSNWKPSSFSGDECKMIVNTTECVLGITERLCSNHSHAFISDFILGILHKTPCWGVLAGLDVINWEHYLLAVLLPKHIPTKDRLCANNVTALDVAHQGMINASKCWNAIIDNSFLMEDIQAANEHKAPVAFLKKYCPKAVGLASCVGDYLDSFQSCVEEEDAVTLEATKDIVAGLVNFLCYRNGERIMLFLKEDGIQCMEKQMDSVRECVEGAGIYDLFRAADGSLESGDFNPMEVLNNLWVPQNYRPEECRVIVALEVCVYKHMKKCKHRSPGNLISSLVRSLARKSPCWKVRQIGGAPSLHSSWSSMINVSFTLLVFLTWRYN